MSDYERNKVVAYPISKELYNVLDDKYNFRKREDGLYLNSYYDYKEHQCNYYLTYILYYDYGCDEGEFGRRRELRDSEKEKYKKIFEEIIPIDEDKFRYLDYVYYNGTEAPDYYVSRDQFEDEI